jgi:hypothetical protein
MENITHQLLVLSHLAWTLLQSHQQSLPINQDQSSKDGTEDETDFSNELLGYLICCPF